MTSAPPPKPSPFWKLLTLASRMGSCAADCSKLTQVLLESAEFESDDDPFNAAWKINDVLKGGFNDMTPLYDIIDDRNDISDELKLALTEVSRQAKEAT